MSRLLVCNACADEMRSPISMYLLNNKRSEVIEAVSKAAAGDEVMYFLPESVKGDEELKASLTSSGASVNYGTENITTRNANAIIQELKGYLPRPMVLEGFVPEYEGKVYEIISPEEALQAAGSNTKIVFVVDSQGKSEVKEVKLGAKASEICNADGAKAVLLGGQRGLFLQPSQLNDFIVGNGYLFDSVTVYEQGCCMVDAVKKLMNDNWKTSCGKCVLCREGTLQFSAITNDMTTGKAKPGDVDMLLNMCDLISKGAYCEFGRSMPGPLKSALKMFSAEFDEHIKLKKCSAGLCYKAEKIHYIDPKLCTGCGECIDACPEDAIEGKDNFIHMIDQDMCEQCGKCVAVCEECAILTAEGKLPKLPKKLTKCGKF